MAKICAFCPLHYGAAYLKQAVNSVAPFVDKVYILYTREPSFGHWTRDTCPDTEAQLRACVEHLGDKVQWHTGQWGQECSHRDTIFSLSPDADLVLPFDADEVWDAAALAMCIADAMKGTARNYLIQGWFHFWRAFDRVCVDTWAPVRIIKPGGVGDATLHGKILHFGYAQSEAIVQYKMAIHGHKDEIRHRWLEDTFLANKQEDVHPCVINWWNAQPFDKTALPAALREHQNYGKSLIQ